MHNKFILLKVSLILGLLLLQPFVYADESLQDRYVERFSDLTLNLDNAGQIGELMAVDELKERYPETTHEIFNGIKYFNEGHSKTAGELDVVVVERSTNKVLLVGEVKTVKKKRGAAINHAQDQLKRFGDSLREGKVNKLVFKKRELALDTYDWSSFQTIVIGPKAVGADQQEFPRSLRLTFRQIKAVLDNLVRIQGSDCGRLSRSLRAN